MARRLFGMLPVALGLLVAACADQNDSGPVAPGAPAFKVAPLACNSSAFPSLVNTYFATSTERQKAQAFINSMTAIPYGTNAQDNGFSVMQLISAAVKSGNTAASTGSTLTKELIKCMYDASTSSDFPSNFATLDFTAPLDPSVPGAYEVRDGGDVSSTNNIPVASRTTIGVIVVLSGVAPPQDLTVTSPPEGAALPWSHILSERALIYGIPVAGSDFGGYSSAEYQWEAIRPGVAFGDGGATVALCQASSDPTSMVSESDFGVLAYIGTDYICDRSYALIPQGWGAQVLVQRLLKVFTPQPLFASGLSIGGAAGGLKSKFGKKAVPSITFAFDTAPPATMFLKKMPYRVSVLATTSDGDGVNGVCAYMHGSNNNGQNLALSDSPDAVPCANTALGDISAITKSKTVIIAGVTQVRPGYADFDLSVSKTGGLNITVTSTDGTGISGVIGRDGQTFNTLKLKTNVKP